MHMMNHARRTAGRRRRGQRGAVTVEAALVLPLLLFFLAAAVDFSRYMWVRDVVREAASQGLRMAVLSEPTMDEVRQRVALELENGGVNKPASVEVGTREPGLPVTITVATGFEYLFLPGFLEDIITPQTVSSSATGLCER